MKLVRKVAALAKRRRDRDQCKPLAGVGLVWSSAEVSVDRAAIPAGCHIATDVFITEHGDGSDTWATAERYSPDAGDLGAVYDQTRTDERRTAVGRVVSVDGSLWTLEMEGEGGGEVSAATPR
jgi:hypothetical protein